MAEQTVTVPNEVGSAYEDFLQSFRAVVEDSNLNLAPDVRPIRSSFLAAGGDTEAVFTWRVYLKAWPCRRLAGNKRLDVVVKAMETFSRDSWKIIKSTVYVNYIVVNAGSARLVQALHYDFVEPAQKDHPFFHVHLNDEPIPPDDLRASGFEMELTEAEQPNECWVATRIPTPEMTLASVLYCLVADHLGDSRFGQFSHKIRSIEDRLPPPAFDSIKKSLDRFPGHFKSSHWFAHNET